MKRTTLVIALAVMFFLIAGISVNSAFAVSCSDQEVSCWVNADKSQSVAKTKFSRCWSWKHLGCMPCGGEKEWSYAAKWCDKNYKDQCKERCWACFRNPIDSCVNGTACWSTHNDKLCIH